MKFIDESSHLFLFSREFQNKSPCCFVCLQEILRKCIGLFEDSTRLVSLAGMFSKNENYEEIPTDCLRYLLLPFFLGQLTTKLCVVDRKNVVDTAKVYYE